MSLLLTALLALSGVEGLQAPPDYTEIYRAGERGLKHLQANVPALKATPELAELALLAFVRSELPETAPPFRDLLNDVLSHPATTTRSASLQASALAELDRLKYRPRIADAAQLLIDQQAQDGLWAAGAPVESIQLEVWLPEPRKAPKVKPQVRPRPLKLAPRSKGPPTGDVANAAWAVAGLQAAADAGIEALPEMIDRALAAWRPPERPAAEAVACLATLLELQKRDPRKNADVLAALARLEQAPVPESTDDLRSLRTAMLAVGRARLGTRDWFLEGGEALRRAQKPDGSWGDLENTARAVLFIGVEHRPLHRN